MCEIKDLQAVIVLYNTKIAESITINSLSIQLQNGEEKLQILIYDNSFEKQEVVQLPNLEINYIHNPANPGVGVAYNEGQKFADINNKKWLLLLDQDTQFPDNFFRTTFSCIIANPDIKLFVPILKLSGNVFFSPVKNKHKRGYALKTVESGLHSLNKYSAVNSGMILPVAAFAAAGGYNPDIKLDFADFQFLERFKKHYDLFYVTDAICYQNFSGFDKSVLNQQKRFDIYLNDARLCVKPLLIDKIGFLYTVARHALALSVKTRKLFFVKQFVKKYLLNNNKA